MNKNVLMRKFLPITGLILLSLGIFIGLSKSPDQVPEFPLADDQLPIMTTVDGVEYVRTPDEFFADLPGWSYEAKYVEIDGLRQAYYEAGPADGEVVLLLHGQPTWSYLYRFVMPELAEAGYRVIAMDHLGMGRSDKPIDLDFYTYMTHVERLEAFIQKLELDDKGITVFLQDWGSLIGLNVVGNHPDWFDRVVLGNGTLPTWPEGFVPVVLTEDLEELKAAENRHHSKLSNVPASMPQLKDENGEYTLYFKLRQLLSGEGNYNNDRIIYALYDERFRVSINIEAGTFFALPPEERAAFDAPFPARITMAAPRVFPGLINDVPGKTDSAWDGLRNFEKPFLTIIGNNDTGLLGSVENQNYFIENIPGAKGQPHARLMEAGHFVQYDQGVEVARLILEFIAANPVAPK